MRYTKIYAVGVKFVVLSLILTPAIYAQNWGWPTVSDYITSDFGPRNIGYWDFHEGIDITAAIGTDVYAVEDGTFTWRGGNMGIAVVDHDNGMASRYLHCRSPIGNSPRRVRRGERIALSGIPGTREAHLHFDFTPRGKGIADHPLIYLPYNNTSDPTVSQFENLADGDIVSGIIDVRTRVLTTIDKDLNRFDLQVDGNRIDYISYDPNVNCNPNTCIPNGLGNDTFVITWNTTQTEDGKHTLTGQATDARGRIGKRSIPVYIDTTKPIAINLNLDRAYRRYCKNA